MAKSIKCPSCGVVGTDAFKLICYVDFDNGRKKVLKCLACDTEFFVEADDK